jgi:dCMP deaminase
MKRKSEDHNFIAKPIEPSIIFCFYCGNDHLTEVTKCAKCSSKKLIKMSAVTGYKWRDKHWSNPDKVCKQSPKISTELKSKIDPQPTRPPFQFIYMRLAHELAARSTCARLKVGTVITSIDFRKVLAIGYNGNAMGLPNCCDNNEPGNCGCIHSEENAIINCDSPRHIEKVVFVTHLPCKMCAKKLVNLGNVISVYYNIPYRLTDALEIFDKVGIKVEQLEL